MKPTKNEDEIFDEWYENQQGRFHCGQFTEKQIAYSAYLKGLEIGKMQERGK